MQLTVGTHLLPSEPINGWAELQHSLYKTFHKWNMYELNVYSTFKQLSNPFFLMAVPLEVSPVLSETGVSISAQRACVANLQFSVSKPRRFDTFVRHSNSVTLQLDQAIVRT